MRVLNVDLHTGIVSDVGAECPPDLPAEGGLGILEQVGAGCVTKSRPILYAMDEKTHRALMFRPDCKMWKCPHCANINKLKWVYRIKKGVQQYESEGDKFWFVTLTTHRSLRTFEKSLAVWRHAWDKLYHRMKRANPRPMHYVLLPELAPETGRLHAHMLINCDFGAIYKGLDKKGKPRWDCRWMKDNPAECGLGYMNDVRPVDNAGLAAWYVSKYVGKSLEVDKWPEHFRRVRPSVGWPEQEVMDESIDGLSWVAVMPHKFESVVENLWSNGFDVVNLKSGEILEYTDLQDGVKWQ